ncbi:uncharacterized protein B0H18DRAFT_1009913 [Fomitopsis serialis]|uniref:uncharacterized protein n=1 Tax=Fomitopsis serialis TaxID=139415 RepID=UPI002008AAC5|nr:uncharacterized protein B0H18DRAFT_1009913 [Neoantrodia serialis]KAH9925116.1 hypothetical protein B0H18DRAFT_1009913 [Neoantrodia serialis]
MALNAPISLYSPSLSFPTSTLSQLTASTSSYASESTMPQRVQDSTSTDSSTVVPSSETPTTPPTVTTKTDAPVFITMTSVSTSTWTTTMSPSVSGTEPTMPPTLSTVQVMGIATAVVMGALCILVLGAVCVYCCMRSRKPSHKFLPLEDAGEEPPDDSPVFLDITHNKSSWMHKEAVPLSWRAPSEPRTPTTPASPGASDLLTIATVGSPELPGRRSRAMIRPQSREMSRASRVLSWMGNSRSSRTDADEEVDSGLRFKYELRRVSTASALLYSPPPYSES